MRWARHSALSSAVPVVPQILTFGAAHECDQTRLSLVAGGGTPGHTLLEMLPSILLLTAATSPDRLENIERELRELRASHEALLGHLRQQGLANAAPQAHRKLAVETAPNANAAKAGLKFLHGNNITSATSGLHLIVDGAYITSVSSTGVAVDGAITAAGAVTAGPAGVLVGNQKSRFAENNVRFNSGGAAYIDHSTPAQDVIFRTSSSSRLDTTAMTIGADGKINIGGTRLSGEATSPSYFAGSVGIGTTAPEAQLNLAGTGGAALSDKNAGIGLKWGGQAETYYGLVALDSGSRSFSRGFIGFAGTNSAGAGARDAVIALAPDTADSEPVERLRIGSSGTVTIPGTISVGDRVIAKGLYGTEVTNKVRHR